MGSFFIVSCQERKEKVIDPMTSFLMFFPKVPDSIFKPKSPSLIKTSNERKWFISYFNFKLMDMITFKASFNN
jgi:hypothetical protein